MTKKTKFEVSERFTNFMETAVASGKMTPTEAQFHEGVMNATGQALNAGASAQDIADWLAVHLATGKVMALFQMAVDDARRNGGEPANA